jgi:amino-acid N-acetyltransferase
VPRVHIIDGREHEGLLAEVFSHQGIGTLIHANEYQAIRPAQKKDLRAIHELVQTGVQTEELASRSRADLERLIQDFYVFEVDRTPVACMALHPYAETNQVELASMFVAERYANQGIGAKMMQFAEGVARGRGAATLFCLSTQAFNYFLQKGGFRLGTPDDLPPDRRERYDRSGRRSQVLIKPLTPSATATEVRS